MRILLFMALPFWPESDLVLTDDAVYNVNRLSFFLLGQNLFTVALECSNSSLQAFKLISIDVAFVTAKTVLKLSW